MRLEANQILFDNWLLRIGNGHITDVTLFDKITHLKCSDENQAMNGIIDAIFPDINRNITATNSNFIKGHCILAPTNKSVDMINNKILNTMTNVETFEKYSMDTIIDSTNNIYPTELLNSLKPKGFPPHKLILKPGTPLMLLRNLLPKQGLCNRTRLHFISMVGRFILQCKNIDNGEIVLIPRITLNTTEKNCYIIFSQHQFPVTPAFAMTINKSQGQTLGTVGLYLAKNVFTHGQLYVALSRVKKSELLTVVTLTEKNQNIVFNEVLH